MVVSGPMPLGRPSRANLEADSRRKHEDANPSRGRLSSGRRVLAGPESHLDAHEFQPSLNRSSQDAPVNLKPSIKKRTASFPDEQLVSSRSHNIAADENVQYHRDILPSPPVSPPPSLYPRRTAINGSSPSSPPSAGNPSATATEVPAATTRLSGLYGEPRYPTSRSTEKPPVTNASTSSAMKPRRTESSHKPTNSFSAMGNSLSSNQQASHDIEPLESIPASPHQGAALNPHLNGRVERTRLSTAPVSLPPNVQISQDQFDRRTSRVLSGDPSLPSTGTPPPQDSAYRNIFQALDTETVLAPLIITPPESPDKHPTSARRTTTQSRGHRHVLAAPNPESEPAPEPTRRGPLIFNAREAESRHTSQERESPRELGQGGYQHPQVIVKPLPSRPVTGSSPERGSVIEPRRSIAPSQSFKQEQVTRAIASYEDEAPPTAHPALRKISKGSKARMHTPFQEDRKPSFAEHSSSSRRSNRLRKQRSPSDDLSSASNPAFMQDSPQSAWQANQNGNLSILSPSQPVREGNTSSSPDSSTPPTPPEKSTPHDARSDNEWSHHVERQFSSKRLASTIDVEIEPRRDMRIGWAVPVPAEAQFEEVVPTPSDVEDDQEDVQETHLLNGFSRRESPIRSASSIDENSFRAPTSVDQLQDGSYDSIADTSDPQMDEPNEPIFEYGPQHPQNATQRPWEDEDNLASQPSVDDIELVARPRRRTLPPPASPEEYSRARARRRGTWLEKSVPEDIAELAEETKPTFYPLLQHLQNRELLTELLTHLSFCEWLILWGGVSKAIRQALDSDPVLCDVALERYLGTVGYARWSWSSIEPIRITLAEMRGYMRGVSKPVHVYAQTSLSILSSPSSEENVRLIRDMKKETRAFNRIVIRLRAQAEADAEQNAVRRKRSIGQAQPPQRQNNGPPLSWSAGKAQGQGGRHRSVSRQSSRAPSPTNSMWSQGAGSQVHLPLGTTPTSGGFRSPLFRLRRAPLLRVFVPSPEGDWLSDAGVLECEKELRKAGILPLLRVGDVVWDTALGDEGNVGRLVWDGRYLIDLDYAFSQIGDVPPSLPALAFPPSYFHRVIRVAGDRNPIAHLDIRFWGEEIISNLQLLQDRVRTETPQGAYHTVVRWVNRSSFTIFPPPAAPVIMLPNKERRLVDPGWRGTVIVEAEGTNEGLSDLHARCRGVFQRRAGDVAPPPGERERMVWRVLRERSRPGEIWIRAVSYKERLTP